ncbi:hypothetical protein ACQPZ2_23990 [Nocardia pseudovaccinii]|uniref:hypothetical protein n=1 Tax=Nocardia pseudovaccinii TaxID=189540 RepID=UPI003D8DFAB5
MDHINRFATKTTFTLLRVEYGIFLIACTTAFFLHLGQIRWVPAVILFVYIDLIGYVPGLIAHLRSETGEVSRFYYVLYNTMHSMTTQSAVVALWVLVSGWEWALLVVPIHLFGDRALFGNFVKSFAVPFEPKAVPAFTEFERRVLRGSSGAEPGPFEALIEQFMEDRQSLRQDGTA